MLAGAIGATAEPLPNTKSITWSEADLSGRLMDGAHAFVDRKISESEGVRFQYWNRNPTADYAKSIEKNRLRFREIIGLSDTRLSPRMEFVAAESVDGSGNPASSVVAETPKFTVHQIRWSVLDGLSAEGLYVNPKATDDPSTVVPPAVILIPDADETPEDMLGIGGKLLPEKQMALRFADAGFRVIIPATINRKIYAGPDGNDSRIKKSDQTHREWIYRQAFQMGRHVIGYEVQSALAAVDWLRENQLADTINVAGYGEGGLVAFYSAAVDPRIDNALVSGYFGPRHNIAAEPIYRNVFGLLREFGDAEIATLIWPRTLVIENSLMPKITDQKGEITQPTPEALSAEVDRIGPLLGMEKTPPQILLAEANGNARGDFPAVAVFAQEIGFQTEIARMPPMTFLFDARPNFKNEERHQRIFQQMENHVQSLIRKADVVRRERFFHTAEPQLNQKKWTTEREFPILDPANFIQNARPFRDEFRKELIGEFDEVQSPLNPRSRQILKTEKWTAWDVKLDVYPEFFAWGALILPNDLKPNEKRPVVVCQHGRNGLPIDTIDVKKTAYGGYAAKLAERGFIVFSPHNLYRGEERYRWLDRKSNALGCSMFSLITASHEQIISWLKTQPNVDPKLIGFYGLSYGGESAVRLPALIEDYALSICSGDFNQWTRKVAATDFENGFMGSIEWEMPYWNLGHTFDYAEMAGLIFPRPFMVERGHHDRVSRDEWVTHEYAKVRWLYAQFGLADKTEIEFFQGGHSINGQASFNFLHKHLNWPKP